MNVLLVDDEIFTIRMLQDLIPWNNLGLKVVGYAQNGEEAYAKVIKDNPDIIVSDIKMPEMNGLEFLKKVTNFNPAIKTILMSAHADFSYVKEGLKLGCSDYILKPIDELELEHTLRKLILEIQGEKEQENIIIKSAKQLDKISIYQFMHTGQGIHKIKRTDLWHRLEIQQYSVFLIQIDSATIDEYNNSANIEMGQEGYICKVLECTLSALPEKFMIFDYEDGYWTIILEEKGRAGREEAAKKMIAGVREDAGISVNVCFSSVGAAVEELPMLYEEVRNLSKYSFYVGEQNILGYGYNCNKKELDEVCNVGIMKDMEQAIRDKNLEKIYTLLNEAFELSTEYYPSELRDIYELCYQSVLYVRKQIPVSQQTAERYKEIYELTYEKLQAIPTLKELKIKILQIIDIIPELSDEKRRLYSKPVEESIRLMEQRYNENLSLEEICEEIAVSKNYFCYLFKRETGMKIWDYLTGVRLQHAKKLLEDTQLRSYEIAFQVGYDNPSYFSKIFKKYENRTPNEYRESKKVI